MANVVVDPKSLPERAIPIPGSKPPVSSLPYKDLGHPEEVDAFRKLIREIRRQAPDQPEREFSFSTPTLCRFSSSRIILFTKSASGLLTGISASFPL
jgi:hypothetical protein